MENTVYHQRRIDKALSSFKNNDIPSRYSLVLSNRCNLSCDFCFQHRKRIKGQLTKDEWIRVIKNVIPEGSHLTLTGGEPIVFKGFEEIFIESNKIHTTNIITNGTRFTEPLIELFASTNNLNVLSISIDTIGNINRKVFPQQYQNMIKMLTLFKKIRRSKGPNLDTKTVVTDDNAGQLFSVFKHCAEEIGVDSMSFQMLKGSPIQHADKCYSYSSIFNEPKPHIYKNVDLIFSEFEKIKKYVGKYEVNVYTHPHVFNFGERYQNDFSVFKRELTSNLHDPSNYETCKAPWESMHVNADGKAFPCLAIEVGNVIEVKNIYEFYDSGVGAKFRDELRKCGTFPACSRCGYLKVSL